MSEGNPTRDALAALAERFQEIAESTGDGSPTYKGYKLAMEHAAQRAWTAADEANEPEDAGAYRTEPQARPGRWCRDCGNRAGPAACVKACGGAR